MLQNLILKLGFIPRRRHAHGVDQVNEEASFTKVSNRIFCSDIEAATDASGAEEADIAFCLPDSVLGPVPAPDEKEKSDTYCHVALRINERWRVIVCKDGIQWILQVRKGSYNGRPAWRRVSFVRGKVGLRRVIREAVGDVSPEVEAQLAQLPDWVQP